MTPLYFRIYVDEKRSIRVTARIEEYEYTERTWLVVATAQLWRMTRMRGGTGELIGLGPLGDAHELRVRGSCVSDALQRLVDKTVAVIVNGLHTEH